MDDAWPSIVHRPMNGIEYVIRCTEEAHVTNRAFFAKLVRAQYDTAAAQLHFFERSTNAERAVFQVNRADGTAWIIRAYRRDIPVPDWLGGCGTRDTYDWLMSRAATLIRLAHHDYPAPRVITTRGHALVGVADGWCTLATTFIEGTVAQPTLAQLRLLGGALGRLHMLPVPDAGQPPIGTSWWFAELAVPIALAQLAAVEQILPAEWQPLSANFQTTLRTIRLHSDLPYTIIHGDSWAGNTIQTAADQVVQIDWEPSGLGPAVVDLGRLLLACHYDLQAPLEEQIHPDSSRIAAVMDGYCKQRRLSAAELEALLEAIRFSVAVGGAWHFARIEQLGWDTKTERRLARLQQRYQASAEIAQLARECVRNAQ
jgi:Ser/Thr protein kinase RdoA (MazF antagonist)